MLKRLLPAVLMMILTSAITHAAARNPQIPVSGTALATFFASQGQAIDVNNQQLDLQTQSVPVPTAFEVHTFLSGTATAGIYNATASLPPLYQVFPGAAATGWFAAASFRDSPMRLVVNLFDASDAYQGSNTYLGADPSAFGFYVQLNPGPVFYQEDSRNPGARILAYNGTGARAGWTWFACETGPGPGGDYADFIILAQLQLAPTAVSRTDWGTLKQRFR